MFDFVTVFRGVNNFLIPWGLVVMPGPIALPLDSLLLRGVAARPCFWLRARCHKHARRHARPRESLKAGLGTTPRNNRLSNGRAMDGTKCDFR